MTLLSSLPCSQASQHGSNLWGSTSADKATFPRAPTWHFRVQSIASPCLYFPTQGSLFFKTCPWTSPCLTPVSRQLAPRSSCSPLHFRKMLLQRALGAATLVLSKTGRHSGLPPQGSIWLHPSPTPPTRPHQQQSLGNIISQTSQTSLGNISPTPAVSPTEVQAGEEGRGLLRCAASTWARDNQPNPDRPGAPAGTATAGSRFLKAADDRSVPFVDQDWQLTAGSFFFIF